MKIRSKYGISCKACKVKDLCIVNSIQDEKINLLDLIVKNAQVYLPGEHLYFENDKTTNVYAVYDGLVKDYHIDMGGNEYIKEFYFPGDILGLEFLNEGYFKLSAIAIKKTVACLIPGKKIMASTGEIYTYLKERFFQLLSQQIDNRYDFNLTTNARSRVAAFFLNIIKREKERSTVFSGIPIFMSYLDISNKLGMANETFSRILHEFMDDNLLKIINRNIVYFDSTALLEILYSDK